MLSLRNQGTDTLLRHSGEVVLSPHMYSYLHRVVIFSDLSDTRNQTECCEIFLKPLGVV